MSSTMNRAERRAAHSAKVLATVNAIQNHLIAQMKGSGTPMGRAADLVVREMLRGFSTQEKEVLRTAIRTFCYRNKMPSEILTTMIRATQPEITR
jgi:hypothetical protein